MVRRQLMARGITDRRVLAAMATVPRERFVPLHLYDKAYDDSPLPVGFDQTISQPYIVGLMTQEARLTRRSSVLEVGTGTGYHTAILATIARHVWSVERLSGLSHDAARRLEMLGIKNVTLVVGDGALGYPQAAPYDSIVVAAAAPAPPQPLLEQMARGGRMVIPIGDLALQEMVIVERTDSGHHRRHAGPCRFVPLVSTEAFGDG